MRRKLEKRNLDGRRIFPRRSPRRRCSDVCETYVYNASKITRAAPPSLSAPPPPVLESHPRFGKPCAKSARRMFAFPHVALRKINYQITLVVWLSRGSRIVERKQSREPTDNSARQNCKRTTTEYNNDGTHRDKVTAGRCMAEWNIE